MIEPKFKYLSAAQVCEYRGCKATKLYDDVRTGRFPAGELLGANTRRWRSDVVADWLEEQSLQARSLAAEASRKTKARSALAVEGRRRKVAERAMKGGDHAPA